MKSFRVLTILIFAGICFIGSISAQERANERIYLLQVTSTDSQNPRVRFSSAYACQISNDFSPLVLGEQETPFETKLSGTNFLGMFKAISDKGHIEVSLVVMFPDGSTSCEAKCKGSLSILTADPRGVRTGWPTTASDLSTLEELGNTQDSKQK